MHQYPLAEKKLMYRVLHRHLADHPELMDAQFMDDLQRMLQQAAQGEGVDVSDHGQWDAWLGNEPVACSVRNEHRTVLKPR